MRTFIACAGIDGQDEALERFLDVVEERRPDAVLFAGGVFHESGTSEAATEAARRHADMQLLERFYSTVGQAETFVAVIPGPGDAPLRLFLRAGMNAETQSPGVHIVHAALASDRDAVICGIGGELTRLEDSGDPVVRCSRTTADYFLRALGGSDGPQKVMLLAVPPTGELGGQTGNALVGELINSYHPKLCVVAGPTALRGSNRVAHTTIVNPGRLADGSAAWIDWSREIGEQVELFDLRSSVRAR